MQAALFIHVSIFRRCLFMYVSNNAVVVVTIVSNKPAKLFMYVSNKHGIGAAGLPLFLPFFSLFRAFAGTKRRCKSFFMLSSCSFPCLWRVARLSLRPFSVRDLLGRNGKKVVELYTYYSLLSFAGSGAGSLRGCGSDCLRWLSVVL